MDKQSLRLQLKNIRKNIISRNEKNQKISDNILSLISSQKEILIYINAFTEVNTLDLCEKLINENIAVYVPKCVNENDMIFYKIKSLEQLKKGRYGILEPLKNLEILKNKDYMYCLVPGLGFDLNGYRIGYGKGYYDKLLSENKLISIGVCYSEQIVEKLPIQNHDQRLNYIITDKFIKEI